MALGEFDHFVARLWPKNIIRAKGICYFRGEEDVCYLFEQAGHQVHLQENGLFVASAPEEEFKRIVADNPEIMDDWDDVYGDRMTKIVFIGRHMNREAIEAGLDGCLVDWTPEKDEEWE